MAIPGKAICHLINDDRLIAWLSIQISVHTRANLINLPIHLTGRDLAIAILDIWAADLNQKILTIINIKNTWIQHIQQDHSETTPRLMPAKERPTSR